MSNGARRATTHRRARTVSLAVNRQCIRCGATRPVTAMDPDLVNDWGDPHKDANWSCKQCPEHDVMTWIEYGLTVGVTSRGRIWIRPAGGAKLATVAGPDYAAAWLLILEQARGEATRIIAGLPVHLRERRQ